MGGCGFRHEFRGALFDAETLDEGSRPGVGRGEFWGAPDDRGLSLLLRREREVLAWRVRKIWWLRRECAARFEKFLLTSCSSWTILENHSIRVVSASRLPQR